MEIPNNKLGLKNFSILKSPEDRIWAGLKKGQSFPIVWDGEYIRAGGLTWSVERLINEIEDGLWIVESNNV